MQLPAHSDLPDTPASMIDVSPLESSESQAIQNLIVDVKGSALQTPTCLHSQSDHHINNPITWIRDPELHPNEDEGNGRQEREVRASIPGPGTGS